MATSQPDAATQALLQTVELLTQQVKHMQDREHERRRSRSRDRRRRTRSDSREYYRGRRRDDSREYRRGRSRSLSRRRSPSFGRIPTPPKLIPREPEGPPPRWHYYGSGRGTSRDSEQSAWHERRYVSSSERPGASHFPRATGAWPSHLEFPTVEGDGPWNRRVNLEHMPLELLNRIWDSVPDLGMKASRCALRWAGPFFPGSTSLTSEEIAKSNHELNVKIVVQHETYDHGKHSAKPSRAYYTDYMKNDGWQVSSFEHVEGQWEMTLLRGSLENQPLELDWYVKGRILIFSPPFVRPEELEDVEEEERAGGDDQEDGDDGQEPPGEDGDDEDGPNGGPSKRTKTEATEMAKPVEPADEIPKEESMEDTRDAEPVEPFHGCTAIDPSNAPKEELSDDDVVTMSTRSTPDRPTSSREVLDRDKFIMSRFQGEIELSSDSESHAFVALDHRTMNKGEKQVFVAGLQTLQENDSVLHALVSNNPLSVQHMVIVKDDLLINAPQSARVFDVGASWAKTRKEVIKHISNRIPGLVVLFLENTDPRRIWNDMLMEVDMYGCNLLLFTPLLEISVEHSICLGGDLEFALAGPQSPKLLEALEGWCGENMIPKCFEDAKSAKLLEMLNTMSEDTYLEHFARTCFVADELEDISEIENSDIEGVLRETKQEDGKPLSAREQEELMLDQLALPGADMTEQKRRQLWRALPQRTRIAIRRLHRQFGHPAPSTLKNILKAGKASKELIEAARLVRCQSCEDTAPRPRDHPVGNSNFQYEFNAMLGLDVTEMKDYAGNKYSILTMLDISTGFHLSEVVKEGGGMPTSEACAQAILRRWTSVGQVFQRLQSWIEVSTTEVRYPSCSLRTVSRYSMHHWRHRLLSARLKGIKVS